MSAPPANAFRRRPVWMLQAPLLLLLLLSLQQPARATLGAPPLLRRTVAGSRRPRRN
jgi:hypothetical protein